MYLYIHTYKNILFVSVRVYMKFEVYLIPLVLVLSSEHVLIYLHMCVLEL